MLLYFGSRRLLSSKYKGKPRIRPPRPCSRGSESSEGDDDRFCGLIWRSLGHTSSSYLFCGFVFGGGTVLTGLCDGFGYSGDKFPFVSLSGIRSSVEWNFTVYENLFERSAKV